MKIYIVDDSATFRKAIRIFLEEQEGHTVLGEAEDGEQFLKNYKNDADVVLMDLNMPNVDGYNSVKNALKNNRYVKAIAITMFEDIAYLKSLIEMGFRGCVFKSKVYQELPNALTSVYEDKYYFPENIQM